MPSRLLGTPLICTTQFSPPSFVCRIKPSSPTAQPSRAFADLSAGANEIEESERRVPLSCLAHVWPSLAVCRVVPASTRAQPCLSSVRLFVSSHECVFDVCCFECTPPS